MIAYLDSSVILRMLLGEAGRLPEWKKIERPVASVLVEVECFRVLDRLRLRGGISDEALASRRQTLYGLLATIERLEPTRAVLARAAEPFPTALRTLDAIHLATALLWREEREEDLVMATHDLGLGVASRAVGLRVVGS